MKEKQPKDELVTKLTAWTLYLIFLVVTILTLSVVIALAVRLFSLITGIDINAISWYNG